MVLKDINDDVVVFFDFENIVYSLRNSKRENPNFEILMDKCQEYGRVVLARAYADWSRHGSVIAPLQASGFDPVYVPTYFYENKEKKTRKNAVDIHIAIEAVEVMFTQPHINTFVLLTGDKDFIPLANALRRHGKTVIAVGVKGTTSPYMRQSTDDFVFYHQLLEEPVDESSEPPQPDIYTVLVDAVKKLQADGQKTVFPQVKHKVSEMLGSFNEKDYADSQGVPFGRFKDFILEAQRLDYVKLVTTGSVNEVLLPIHLPLNPNPNPLNKVKRQAPCQNRRKPSLTPRVLLNYWFGPSITLKPLASHRARHRLRPSCEASIKSLMKSNYPMIKGRTLRNLVILRGRQPSEG